MYGYYLDLPLFFARSAPRRAPKTITMMNKSNIIITAIIIVRLFTNEAIRSLFMNPNLEGGLAASCRSGSFSITASESTKWMPNL